EKEHAVGTQLVAVAQGAANDAAQHIAAALVGGQHPVHHQKGSGADMVGKHLEGGVIQVAGAGGRDGGANQRLEEVDLVVAVDVLQHCGDALQPHPGIHAGLGQGVHGAAAVPVVLHEDIVPDFDIAVAVLLGTAGGAAPDLGAVVVEDLGTG